ncbi:SusC/RagA family TonB-linked outer membrane protein [Chitinophaga japonensis]|uniref:TonB-linked SusC/RagA family outer membrane protein n=1 Tax=Chitinophaga japonensis TaxID=104662 RepID=A0A562TAP0_CHIJA|nr:SusC/RagA family TonB-linked outer membrane protein [Chitinophaga japonensis]TWI90672.1 TonB-linked SusC/RagA family outer membrane protein [Chitinophaga japonensis]
MKKALLFFTMLMVIVTLAFAQQRQVTGKVTGSDGAPIPFATIQIKGTNSGTTTDQDGNFKLNVTGNDDVLIVRSVGFGTKEVPAGASSTVDVVLETSSESLQEVVVTALGIQRKKNELPYSAQNVAGEDLVKVRESNISNSLSGKVAGLEVRRNNSLGGSTNVVLRGNKSLSGNNQALFVVDGVPIDNSNTNSTDQRTARAGYDYGNAAADINPDDIESVNVLKGAAATALYGSRAANGVIMITTKKGRRGLGVTVNSGVTIGKVDKSTFAKYQKSYGAGYGPYYDSPDGYFFYEDVDNDGTPDLIVPTTEDASWGAAFDPSLQVYGWYSFDPSNPYFGQKRPWTAAANDPYSFFQTATSTVNSVMVDGGGDQGYFKLGYTKNIDKGLLPNSSIKKDQINFGASYNITPKLTASASVNATILKGLGRYGTGYDSKNLMTNFRQWWQTNVDIKEQEDAYNRTKENITWNQAGVGTLNPIYWDNPYWTRYENFQNDQRNRYFGNVMMTYKIADWVDVMGRVSLDRYNERQEERIAISSIDPSEYSRFERSFSEYNYDLMLNFHKQLSSDFNLGGVLGGNVRRTKIESIRATTNGGLLIPRLYALLNTANPMEAPEEIASLEEVDGIFAAANLAYKEMLFLDITARRDQSSTLPDGNNAYYYPSVSLGFLFSKLTASSLPWLSHGKVRANYAEVGAPAPVLYTKDYYDVPTGIDGVPLASINNTKYNPDLKPERTKSWETGLEAGFLNGRVGFDVTYYNTRSLDQIVAMPVSRATGYDFKVVNAGEIQNKGIEVSAFGTPVRTPSFSWTINVNWSRNRNKVKSLPEGVQNLQLGAMQGGVSVNASLNEPYGTIRGTNFVYNENGEKLVDEDGYYQISGTSNEIIGNVNPDWIGGISNTLKYKDLALNFLVDMRKGGDVFSLDMYYGLATGIYPETAGLNDLGNPVRNSLSDGGGIILPGVTADGKVNETRAEMAYGTYGYVYNPAAAFVYDASYVKLREVSLTYSLPRSLMSRLHPIKGIDFSLIGRNLWIIHKNLPHADPEEGMSSGNVQGYQAGAYPTARTFGFNVKVRF